MTWVTFTHLSLTFYIYNVGITSASRRVWRTATAHVHTFVYKHVYMLQVDFVANS